MKLIRVLDGLKPFEIKLDERYYPAWSGSVLAHDLLEHRRLDKIGGVGDELMALGASWYIRGRHGCYSKQYNGFTAERGFVSDVEEMSGCTDYECDVPNLIKCGALEDFREMLEGCKSSIGTLNFVTFGYEWAKRKYSNYCAYSLFWELSDCVDEILRVVDIGEIVNLSLNFKEREFKWRKLYE